MVRSDVLRFQNMVPNDTTASWNICKLVILILVFSLRDFNKHILITETLIKHISLCSLVSTKPFCLVYAGLLLGAVNKKLHMRRCPCSHCRNTCNKTQDELSCLCVSLTLPFLYKLGERQSKIILVLLLPESQRACFLL